MPFLLHVYERSVIISIAMEDEAKPFIDHLGLKAETDFFPRQAPFHAFTGSYKECDVTIITAGKDDVHGEFFNIFP